MRPRITGLVVHATAVTAGVTASARDFASLLPATITLHDLGGREKAGPLPRELTDGQDQSSYRAGQLGNGRPEVPWPATTAKTVSRFPIPGS
ncbi:cyclophilin-like fold protein [Rhodococcus sp. ACPA1]|uniref:cyclophilin-like fold protein n=1 Tax=Rhodococcus sp. ACPA1 TaxID=2028572 RepID=UPI00211C6E04|nr:cyclophilin-like fold protein [Rhodococcus sp. ACPA1]